MNRIGIKDDQIRRIAGNNKVVDPVLKSLCWEGSKLAYGLLQRKHAIIANKFEPPICLLQHPAPQYGYIFDPFTALKDDAFVQIDGAANMIRYDMEPVSNTGIGCLSSRPQPQHTMLFG